MSQLLIENVGHAPLEALTVLGVSTTRDARHSDTIGMFGSGAKHAAMLLLRNGVGIVIYSGNLKIEFYTKPMIVNDGLGGSSVHRKVWVKTKGTYLQEGVKRSSNKDIDLGFTMDYGSYDWNDINMACREFVSNALDRTVRQTGSFSAADVKIVDDVEVKAKSGWTRVFIQLTDEVHDFYKTLGKRFLHFSEPGRIERKVLPKADRNLRAGSRSAMIYKKGVFIREVSVDLPSIFDYNFGDELPLDESRNVDDYRVEFAAAVLLRDADPKTLLTLFEKFQEPTIYWESRLPSHVLTANMTEDRKEAIRDAWDLATGGLVISPTESGPLVEMVKAKGHGTASLQGDSWFNMCLASGVKSIGHVLSNTEKKGRQLVQCTTQVHATFDEWWRELTELGLIEPDQAKPALACFTSVMDASAQTFGEYDSGENTIYIHDDINKDPGNMLKQTMLEEIAHCLTGSTDMSRDFQDWAFRLATKLMIKNHQLVDNINSYIDEISIAVEIQCHRCGHEWTHELKDDDDVIGLPCPQCGEKNDAPGIEAGDGPTPGPADTGSHADSSA